MKKIFSVTFALLALALYGCGGGDDNSLDPNNSSEAFENPSGTLTESNANAVGNASVDAFAAGGATNPFSFTTFSSSSQTVASKYNPKYGLEEGDIEACITTDEGTGEVTIDWECAFDVDDADECTGGGTTVTSADDTEDFYTLTYNDFSIDCGAGFEFSCDGTVNISTTEVGSYCSDLTCTVNGGDGSFEGCVNTDGDILFTVEGETFVITALTTDEGCSSISISITDSTGTHTLTCDVTSAEDECADTEGVETVGSCTIS